MSDPVCIIITGLALGGLGVVFGYIIAHKRKEKKHGNARIHSRRRR